ncbi:MAG: hypothetical protein AB1668_03250 [Nanoarchaeota archaeon]
MFNKTGINKTGINEGALEYWCRQVPECADFLHNFFTTCGNCSYETNRANYHYDLALYAETEQWPLDALLQAFGEIAVDTEKLN